MTALMWLSKQLKSYYSQKLPRSPLAWSSFTCLWHLSALSCTLIQKLNRLYSAYTQTKLLSWKVSIQSSTCFSMPQGLLGTQLGVSTLAYTCKHSLPSTSHTKDFRVVQNTTTDNDNQCVKVKLHIIDKTKQTKKVSFNLCCTSKQWLVNGKMNFFLGFRAESQVPSNSLCSWRWFWLFASLASISWVLGLQTCTITLGLYLANDATLIRPSLCQVSILLMELKFNPKR